MWSGYKINVWDMELFSLLAGVATELTIYVVQIWQKCYQVPTTSKIQGLDLYSTLCVWQYNSCLHENRRWINWWVGSSVIGWLFQATFCFPPSLTACYQFCNGKQKQQLSKLATCRLSWVNYPDLVTNGKHASSYYHFFCAPL